MCTQEISLSPRPFQGSSTCAVKVLVGNIRRMTKLETAVWDCYFRLNCFANTGTRRDGCDPAASGRLLARTKRSAEDSPCR